MAKLTMKQLKSKLSRFMQKMPKQVKLSLDRAGVMVVGVVQSRFLTGQALNVVSGRLRRSIKHKATLTKDGARLSVGTNVFYGRIHELQLGRSRGHQFLQPAVEMNRQKVVNMIADDLIEGYKRAN